MTTTTMDDGARVYYKLTREPSAQVSEKYTLTRQLQCLHKKSDIIT